MAASTWLVILASVLAIYAAFILILLALGRRSDARAIAGFVPDCTVLLTSLMRDHATPRRWLLMAVIGSLALPIDIVRDFLPVIGSLDDAIVIAVTLRWLLRSVGTETVPRQWPGPE